MKKKQVTSRRQLLRAFGAGAGLVVVGQAAQAAEGKKRAAGGQRKARRRRSVENITFDNKHYYDSAGKFDEEKTKDAVIALCQYHRYPTFPALRENLWVSDYGVGNFAKVGLAAYMFVNNEEDKYMMLDIFLMPNQMLPEHWHLAGDKNPPKREGWLVRWGLSHIVGIGEPNLSKDVVIPKCHFGGKATTNHEVIAKPGMFVPLAKVLTRHWQYGGPEGAIITEVANVHSNEAVRHTDPVMNKFFLEG